MRFNSKSTPLLLAVAAIVISNPELSALVLTVQGLGIECTVLFLSLQATTIREELLVVLAACSRVMRFARRRLNSHCIS